MGGELETGPLITPIPCYTSRHKPDHQTRGDTRPPDPSHATLNTPEGGAAFLFANFARPNRRNERTTALDDTPEGHTYHAQHNAEGKAISSRNAATHGLFAKDVVLPGLGEDPQGYQRLTEELTTEMAPRTLVERHYVEKIAAAFWILRRLRRWQAGLFADEALTENERLDKLERALRHETALNRQVDTALKMLNKDVPQFYKSRPRDSSLCRGQDRIRTGSRL